MTRRTAFRFASSVLTMAVMIPGAVEARIVGSNAGTARPPAAQQRSTRAKESPAFAKIGEVREILQTLEQASAEESRRLVERAERLIAEIRRIDPEFDATRLDERLRPYRNPSPAASREPAISPTPNASARPVEQSSPGPVDAAAFHQKNVGKIVFFRKPVAKGSEDPSAIANRFGPGDHIYGIAYLAKSFKEMNFVPSPENLRGSFPFEVYVDGEMQHVYGGFKVDLTRDEYQNPNHKHSRVHVLPNPAEVRYDGPADYILPLTFLSLLAKLPAGRHKVELRLLDPYNPAAVGSFEIDMSGGTGWIASAAEELKQAQAASVTMPAP